MKVAKDRPQIQSFSVPSRKQHVITWIDEMAQRERKSKSEIIIRCVEYYYRKKWPISETRRKSFTRIYGRPPTLEELKTFCRYISALKRG